VRIFHRRHHHHTCAHSVGDLQAHWMCDCHYHNVVAFRCYGCGARPPRPVRALLKALLAEATRRPRRRPGKRMVRAPGGPQDATEVTQPQ
jgi:hypothetical protein